MYFKINVVDKKLYKKNIKHISQSIRLNIVKIAKSSNVVEKMVNVNVKNSESYVPKTV